MNIYVLLRIILHSLLSATNFLALTAAAWSISVSRFGDLKPHASPGAVLVIVGTIAFVILVLMIWAEYFIPHTLMSRARTELTLVPMLIVFQLLTASVATSNTVQSVCHDPISCVTLLILSWIAPLCLIVYYLIVLAVTLDHAKTDPKIWDASPLEHPWFLRFQHLPPRTIIPLSSPSSTSIPTTNPSQPHGHRRQRSSWMPPSLEGPLPPVPAVTERESLYSIRSLPQWARNLRPLRRGVESPFPVQVNGPKDRWEDPRVIDAPVSPSLYTEF